MQVKLWLSAKGWRDGSINVKLSNTKQEALKSLGKESEDEIDNFYDDGMIDEIGLDFNDKMELNTQFSINIE